MTTLEHYLLMEKLEKKEKDYSMSKVVQKMGMTIDEAIEIISDIDKAYRTFSSAEYEAMQKSIDTMRKYQDIQEHIKAEMSFDNSNMDVKNLPGLTRALEIFGEVEDGND